MPGTGAESQQPHASFGVRLRGLRERVGLTQQELAERAHLTPHAISALERGTRTRPYPHTVRSLADALGASEAERSALIAAVPTRQKLDHSRDRGDVGDPHSRRGLEVNSFPRRVGVVVPSTPLYGRDEEILAAAALVKSTDARLVTFTGTGGVGKTRLAVAVSETLTEEFPDGVVGVSLSAVSDASDVIPTIGRALGLANSDGILSAEVVSAHLQPLRLLLVLDNFEHLLSAATSIAWLTAQCPHLTVMATSRSLLRVRGEHEYAVEPLELPAVEAATTEELARAPAGALVLDRVRAVAPHLVFAADDVRALVQICHRLSGLPLAIELATARLRLLMPAALLERLDQVTTSLSARDLPERQRTMRATLDWSFELLDPDEQRLFTILGIFRGGATLEAIEDVAEGSGFSTAAEVFGLLQQLVEHSLVVVRPGGDGRRRFDMLEPVAQYARSRLLGDHAVRAGRAHAQVYRNLVEQAAEAYQSAGQVSWLGRIEAEHANVLVAAERSLDAGDGETAGRITWSMWLYWWLRGQVSVGRRLARQCLEADLPRGVLSRVHLAAATMAYADGDQDASAAHWKEADRRGTADADPEVCADARAGIGLAAMARGNLDAAADSFRAALEVTSEAGDRPLWITSLVHVWLGTVLLLQSDLVAAVREIEHGLALAREREDRLSTYVALYNLSQAAMAADDFPLARRHLEEGITLSEQATDLANLAYFLETLAVVESKAGQPGRVATFLGAAESFRETVGADVHTYYMPDEAMRAAAEQMARTALGNDDYDDAVDAGRTLDAPTAVALALRDREHGTG